MGQVFVFLLVAVVLMAGSGYFGYWFGAGGRQRGRAEAVQKEFDDYRERVSAHFSRTAEHFQAIGKEYRSLYEHMASGAENLCDPGVTDGQLSFDPQPGLGTAEEAGDERDAAAGDSGEMQKPEARAGDDGDEAPRADADEAAAAASADDDGVTPDMRARDSGGESAPHEPEDDRPAAGKARDATDSKASGDVSADDGEIRVEETAADDKEGERTYH